MENEFKNALLCFDKISARRILDGVLQQNQQLEPVYTLVTQTLSEIGEEWAKGELSLSQEYMASRICEDIIDELLPSSASHSINTIPIAVSTLNDYHLLGKKILSSVLKASGIQVIEYKPVDKVSELVKQIETDRIGVLLVSTLMLNSALLVKHLRNELNINGINLKIMVGGAPFNFDHQLWQQVGADAVGYQPSDAVLFVNQMLGRA